MGSSINPVLTIENNQHQIDTIRSVFSAVWYITDPIEDTSDYQFVIILYQSQQSTDLFYIKRLDYISIDYSVTPT